MLADLLARHATEQPEKVAVVAAGAALTWNELKERVDRLEGTLARGVLLLVANLIGVTITLAQQLLAQ